ncbi:MAG: hypothetical protein M0009_11590 [Deltaproteobacteria bacterium]|nr:hypothetical protein [Deltaproteobacteria bacterium]
MDSVWKSMKCGIWVVAALALIGCAGVGGGLKVAMKQESYAPAFRADAYKQFKGKTVLLYNFTNNAANTKAWGYYSADKKVYYEAPVQLESYLWSCFQKAFQHAGIKILDQSAGYYGQPYNPYWWGYAPPPQARAALPKNTAEFQFTLNSMTDQECKFQVLISKNGETKLQKDFTVTAPPPRSAEDKGELEKGAYRLVDQMVTAVFNDKDFQKAL